jgi:hypothetical protein
MSRAQGDPTKVPNAQNAPTESLRRQVAGLPWQFVFVLGAIGLGVLAVILKAVGIL